MMLKSYVLTYLITKEVNKKYYPCTELYTKIVSPVQHVKGKSRVRNKSKQLFRIIPRGKLQNMMSIELIKTSHAS